MRILEFGRTAASMEVVVPTASVDGHWFQTCLRSIQQSTWDDVHVVAVEDSGPSFRFPKSANAGIRRTTKDVLLLNDDTRLAPNALEELLRARKKHGEGAYQMYVHDSDGRPFEIGWWCDYSFWAPVRYAVRLVAPFATFRKLITGTFLPFFPYDVPRDGFHGFTFSASLLTRSVIERVDLLDENFPLGLEDFDYSLRCHLLGVPYYSVPKSIVYHQKAGTRQRGDALEMESRRRFREKWPRRALADALRRGPSGKVAWT